MAALGYNVAVPSIMRIYFFGDMMRKKSLKTIIPLIIALVLCLSFSFFGCGENSDVPEDPDPDGKKDTLTVMLTDDPDSFEIVSENPVLVERGGDAKFVLRMKGDYCVERLTRQGSDLGASIVNGYDGTTTVTIGKLNYSMRVKAECAVASARIMYYPNGGRYIEGGNSSVSYSVGHTLKNRLRPNTEIGTDRLIRDGYVLNGWNTAADGSGEHIGLGSRVTLMRNENLGLYAEWETASPAEDFLYRKAGDCIVISRYIGRDKKVVVPETLDGMPVGWISAGAFKGAIDTVIFPKSIDVVEDGAFTDCAVRELYFYDNISFISDKSFRNCTNFSTVHINAVLAPRYGPDNLYSEINLADKYDILILNENNKKVVVFGGSGAFNSIDTMQMERELGEKTEEGYVCINMAVNGWFNGVAQFEMMKPYLHSGDVFIHAPESSSPFGFMYEVSMTPSFDDFVYNKLRLYACLESNYDLLSLIDFRHVTDLLDGFAEFNAVRKNMAETSYTDYATQINLFGTVYENDLGWIDVRGNFALPKIPRGEYLDAGEADIIPEFIKDSEAHTRLNGYYGDFEEAGVKVCFLTSPVNTDTLLIRMNEPEKLPPNSDFLFSGRPYGIPLLHHDLGEWISDFDGAVDTYLDCTVLLPLSDTLFRTEDLFDADFHLSDKTAPIFTGRVVNELLKVL